MQLAKVVEEVGELCHELTRHHCGTDVPPSNEAIDAIGDIQVTLIILANILGIDYDEALSLAWDTIKNRKGKTVNGSFIKQE